MLILRKIYNWVLTWADKPSGAKILGLMSAAEASFFPIPPDVLLIPLALGKREKALYFGLICSFYSIIGATIGYGIGKLIWYSDLNTFSTLAEFFFRHVPGFSHESFSKIKILYDEYNFMIIFTAGFTPIPFKLFTISAGAFNINLPLFILASTVSRSARFLLVSYLIKRFGEPIKDLIDKYFNILAFTFVLILFGGFILLKFIF
jgi:membrane protein YqaA with SNARE-associated domain